MARSIDQIKADYKNQNMRAVVRDMMKANPKLIYTIAGKEWTPGEVGRNGKVADMVQHLSLWEGQGLLNNAVTEPVATIEETEPVETIEAVTEVVSEVVEPAKVTIDQESEYTPSEAEKLRIAKKIYFSKAASDDLTGLQEYHLKLCQQNKYFLPEFAILIARSRVIIESYADSVSPNGKAHPGSVIALKVAIVKYVKEFVDADNDRFPRLMTANYPTLSKILTMLYAVHSGILAHSKLKCIQLIMRRLRQTLELFKYARLLIGQ